MVVKMVLIVVVTLFGDDSNDCDGDRYGIGDVVVIVVVVMAWCL